MRIPPILADKGVQNRRARRSSNLGWDEGRGKGVLDADEWYVVDDDVFIADR